MRALLVFAFLLLSLITVLMLHAAEHDDAALIVRDYDSASTACGKEVHMIPSLILF